jgi:hypothetical protein
MYMSMDSFRLNIATPSCVLPKTADKVGTFDGTILIKLVPIKSSSFHWLAGLLMSSTIIESFDL